MVDWTEEYQKNDDKEHHHSIKEEIWYWRQKKNSISCDIKTSDTCIMESFDGELLQQASCTVNTGLIG